MGVLSVERKALNDCVAANNALLLARRAVEQARIDTEYAAHTLRITKLMATATNEAYNIIILRKANKG